MVLPSPRTPLFRTTATLPEVPLALLLPIAGGAVFGGVYLDPQAAPSPPHPLSVSAVTGPQRFVPIDAGTLARVAACHEEDVTTEIEDPQSRHRFP